MWRWRAFRSVGDIQAAVRRGGVGLQDEEDPMATAPNMAALSSLRLEMTSFAKAKAHISSCWSPVAKGRAYFTGLALWAHLVAACNHDGEKRDISRYIYIHHSSSKNYANSDSPPCAVQARVWYAGGCIFKTCCIPYI